jgi:hypothetical protein
LLEQNAPKIAKERSVIAFLFRIISGRSIATASTYVNVKRIGYERALETSKLTLITSGNCGYLEIREALEVEERNRGLEQLLLAVYLFPPSCHASLQPPGIGSATGGLLKVFSTISPVAVSSTEVVCCRACKSGKLKS